MINTTPAVKVLDDRSGAFLHHAGLLTFEGLQQHNKQIGHQCIEPTNTIIVIDRMRSYLVMVFIRVVRC